MRKDSDTKKTPEPTLAVLPEPPPAVKLGHGETRADPRKKHAQDKRKKHGGTR
jgi:hypothetical protein